jgi:uncharacterized repeat protein (TIGR01451 family)
LDANANGIADVGENPVTGAITVTAGQQVALVVKEFVPANAPPGARDVITISAAFTYTGAVPALSATLTRSDATTVAGQTGLVLTKTVDKAAAKSGDNITYVIAYRNVGADNLGSLVINDMTPAYTTFVSQTNSALPAGLTSIAATTPAVNASGALRWSFTGNLAPNASGTVTFVVKVR